MKIRREVSDETLLDWVRRRAAGEQCRDIAPDAFDYCRSATNRVKLADMKESREPRDEVEGAYW